MMLRLATLSCLALSVTSISSAQVTIVNGASFRTDQPVTGGSWASAFGSFAGVATTTGSTLPIGKTLAGVTVSVDGVEAPVHFVSATQINFLVPYSITPGLRPVVIRAGGATLNGNLRIMTASPGLFIKDTTAQIPPRGAVLNQDSSENAQANPVRRGQAISIYATGPGGLNPAVADGSAAPANPLARTISTPQVYIGGVAATVEFSGMAPGFAGLWQINAFVPERNFIAGRVPVQVFIDGVDSNEVSIFVAQ